MKLTYVKCPEFGESLTKISFKIVSVVILYVFNNIAYN